MKTYLKYTASPLLLAGLIFTASCNSSSNHGGQVATGLDSGRISTKAFEKKIDGKEVHLYTLENNSGCKALITNYGGRLVSLLVPDKNQKLVDVVAGFNSVDGYQQSTEPYFGATIGRYGNRIAKGRFTLDGKVYTLFTNNGPNTLHGGKKGYQDVVWDAKVLDKQSLELTYLSKDMEEGFPGNLNLKVIYTLTDDNALKISYEAVTDKNTVVNLTNHAFFNLNGEQSGTILKHLVKINADKYTPVDSTLIPLGTLAMVKGTPFDFTVAKTIGDRVDVLNDQLKNGKGYDHNFVLNSHTPDQPVAVVTGDQSGIVMSVYTDQPGLQFYSGNFMQGKNTMKGNHKDDFRTAFALETQHFPDSPNQKSFPSTVLKPGEKYNSVSTYKFTVAQ
ncbi:aldose epimerase family protein [Pedobacter sp.]|jgi:aldose 1-epimerase|uniref:aldose epimerase family protein n=1 Tax=Pedobacter sp. TaxID=1411316 RepID=UPI002BE6DF1B|nr:aldose epimerase family protein [Pedobacter sp.]HWW38270.1 aldose epimerase family protein [Pedobacter sp.]